MSTTRGLLLVLFLILNGCHSPKRASQEQTLPLTRQELTKLLGWAELAVTSARKDSQGGWQIEVTRLPETPGGHATVLLSIGGKVVRVYRGK